MSLFSRLFGGGGSEPSTPSSIDYEGFRITPTPIQEGTDYRLAATIEAEKDGETLRHDLIRADTIRSREEAETLAVAKAKQMIDQMGMRLFSDG